MARVSNDKEKKEIFKNILKKQIAYCESKIAEYTEMKVGSLQNFFEGKQAGLETALETIKHIWES